MEQKESLSIIQLPRDIQVQILQFVCLSEWPLVTDILPLALSSEFIWRYIELDQLDKIDDDLVPLLIEFAHSIKSLSWTAGGNWKSQINCNVVLQHFVNLETLNLSRNESFSDILCLYHLRNLKHLYLAECVYIPSYQFDIILPTLENLKVLDVSECNVMKQCVIDIVAVHIFHYLNVLDCFSLELSDLIHFEGKASETLEFFPVLTFASRHLWDTMLTSRPELKMCGAAKEILDEMLED